MVNPLKMSRPPASTPPLLSDGEQALVRLRFHILIVMAVMVTLVFVFGVLFQHWTFTTIVAAVLSLRALLGYWVVSSRNPRYLFVDGVGGIAIVWLGWLGACMVTGQGQSPAVWAILVFPVTAAFMMSTTAALSISLLSLAGVLLLRLSERYVTVPPEFDIGAAEVIAFQLISLSVVAAFAIGGRRVLDRYTQALTRYRLQAEQARAAAEAADRAKSSFLATMSHEIRTPMNGILGLTDLMLGEALGPAQRQRAELVRVSGEALLRLLNDFLDYAKIESGHLVLEQQPLNPRQECETALQMVQAAAHRKGLRLHSHLAVPAVLTGDGGRLRQILLNLLSNAIKFTAQGEVELRATTLSGDGDGDHVRLRFTVRDTGVGIAPDALSRIFQPFEQAEASTTRHFGGTGLGLTICQQLALAMGGSVGVESLPGHGSTFWLELPFLASPSTPETGPAPSSGLADLPQWRARVLLVEDNHVNQVVASGMLAKFGVSLDIVEDGHAAIAAVRAQAYDLILMDCHLPRMDGLEATRQIRAGEPDQARRPIVAMTAAAFEDDRRQCEAAGMDDFLAKPMRLGELERTLQRWLPATLRT